MEKDAAVAVDQAQHGRRRSVQGVHRRISINRRCSRGNGLSFQGEEAALLRLCIGSVADDESFVSVESSQFSFLSLPSSPRLVEEFRMDISDLDNLGASSDFDEEEPSIISSGSRKNFAIGSDDEADNSSDVSYEDNFDPSKINELAEAVKAGCSDDALVMIAEAGLADALAHRVLDGGVSPRSTVGSATPMHACDVTGPGLATLGTLSGMMTPVGGLSGRMTPLAAGGLSGRMTPRRSSGFISPRAAGHSQTLPTFAEEVSSKLQASCEKRSRRASAMQHSSIAQAANRLTRRLSLQHDPISREGATSDIAEVADRRRPRQSISRCARKSILEAASVLEAAGIGVDGGDAEGVSDTQVDDQLRLVQRALEVAQRRHRQSIAQAVKKATGEATEASSAPMVAEAQTSHGLGLPRERVEQIVAAAYARHFQQRSAGQALALPQTGRKKRGKKPAADIGNPRALLNTCTETDGTVHCGPPKRAVEGRHRAARYGSA